MFRLQCLAVSLTVLAAVQAGEVPPKDTKPLSDVVKAVEDTKAGVITQVEFDDGLWEVEVHNGNKEVTLYLDPKTGTEKRRQESIEVSESLPPKGSMPLSAIIKTVEDKKPGMISEVEFDRGDWEVTLRADGKKWKWHIDPMTGKNRTK